MTNTTDTWNCDWLVEDRSIPEADSPADFIRECGAPARPDPDGNGWSCEAGHAHRYDVEYYELEEAQHAARTGVLAPNWCLMDGTRRLR